MRWGADLKQSFIDCFQLLIHGSERFVGHQAGDRQRQTRQDLSVLDDGEPALQFLQCADGRQHIFVIRPDYNDIMRIVRYGCGDGAVLESQPFDDA